MKKGGDRLCVQPVYLTYYHRILVLAGMSKYCNMYITQWHSKKVTKIKHVFLFPFLASPMFRGVALRIFRQHHIRAMSTNNNNKEILALPATAEETVRVDVNDTYKLKELGPVGKFLLYFPLDHFDFSNAF